MKTGDLVVVTARSAWSLISFLEHNFMMTDMLKLSSADIGLFVFNAPALGRSVIMIDGRLLVVHSTEVQLLSPCDKVDHAQGDD